MDEYMQAAFEEARAGFAEGGFPIGSVVVKDGTVVGTGRNRFNQGGDPTSHAELEAIRDAARRAGAEEFGAALEGATCYTTMMPCEMCAGAIIRFGIQRVVVAETTTYHPARTQPLLERQGIEVEVLQDAHCIALVESYLANRPEEVEAMRVRARRPLQL